MAWLCLRRRAVCNPVWPDRPKLIMPLFDEQSNPDMFVDHNALAESAQWLTFACAAGTFSIEISHHYRADGHALALRSNVNHLARASFATDHPHPREGQKMLRCARPDPVPTKGMKIEGMVVWLAQGDWVPSTDLCGKHAF